MHDREPSLGSLVRGWLRPDRPQRLVVAPRRLVVALAPGAVVEPLAADVARWLADLDLADTVALHIVGGPVPAGSLDWRMDMHRPAIVLGPADVLVSKALNRGLGTNPDTWPIEFALVTNGAWWIVADNCPQSTVTLRRLVAMAERWPTAEPLRLTVLEPSGAPTVRLPHPPAAADADGAGADGAGADTAAVDAAAALAAAARERHRAGTRTVLALPTLAAARAAFAGLAAGPERTLLHPYYRPADRAHVVARVVGRLAIADQIVVATQAAAARVDAAVVLTATVPAAPARQLSLVDTDDVLGWFGSEPSTVDEFVLDSAGEAQLAWAHWTPVDASGRPPAGARAPDAAARCRAPLAEVRALAARAGVWRFDAAAEGWTAVTAAAPPRPGELLLAAAGAGGYDPATGVDAAATGPVPDCPTLGAPIASAAAGTGWVSLHRHSTDTRDQARFLLAAIDPAVAPAVRDAVVTAGPVHDAGKWHPIRQDALCALAVDGELVAAGRPWAKSGVEAPLEFAGGVRFRHELASLLLLDGPLRGVLAGVEDADLVRYLVLAHHGKLRRRVDPAPLGVRTGRVTATPPMFGQPAGALTEDVTPFLDGTWTRTVDGLLARYGPFLLAYLETLVRMADWRASAGRPLDD
jgi:hypothetical protein